MDYPAEEGAGLALLGEPHPGPAGGAVHGGRGDLWSRGVGALPGTHTPTATLTHIDPGHMEKHVHA